MKKDFICVWFIVFTGLACAIIGLLGGFKIKYKNMQNDFAQTKCAQYSPITGEFEIIKRIK